MHYYISSPYNGGNRFFGAVNTVKPKNILISVADTASYKNLSTVLKMCEPETLLLDSGAFTVWNSGGVMTLKTVCELYDKAIEKIPDTVDTYFINLDVIPGSKGNKPTKQQVDEACKQSWQNYLVLKKRYKNVLPVFHEDDDWKYLHMMMKETDYIAISPANDSSTARRMIWLDKVYKILKADYKTHGLAATSERLMKRYPFYSVDSINWKTIDMFGNSKVYDKRVASRLTRDNETRTYAIANELRYHLTQADKITRLWEARGVTWK